MASDRGLGKGEPVGNGRGRESRQREVENLPFALRQSREIDAAALALFRRTGIHRQIISAAGFEVIH